MKDYTLFLSNISKNVELMNRKRKTMDKKVFIGLLISSANPSDHSKCMLLNNQKCMIEPTLINLNPIEHSQEFHYYPYAVELDRGFRSCNTLK